MNEAMNEASHLNGGLLFLAQLLFGISIGFLTWMVIGKFRNIKMVKRDYKKIRVPLAFKLLLPLARRFDFIVAKPAWQPSVRKAEIRLTMAGLGQIYTGEEFIGLRMVSAIFFLVIGIFFMALQAKMTLFLGVVLCTYGLVFPTLWLGSVIRKRHKSIQRSLPNVLDLLTLSVEAGRDFLTALRDILRSREMDPLGEELERVFREVQLGKQRRQALRAMAKRVQQPDMTTVVETLAQADELGVSIGQILRILGEQMRQKRFSYAEKLANESPVKLLLPLFLFIFPAVIIVMLGPILLRTFQHM